VHSLELLIERVDINSRPSLLGSHVPTCCSLLVNANEVTHTQSRQSYPTLANMTSIELALHPPPSRFTRAISLCDTYKCLVRGLWRGPSCLSVSTSSAVPVFHVLPQIGVQLTGGEVEGDVSARDTVRHLRTTQSARVGCFEIVSSISAHDAQPFQELCLTCMSRAI
jgi:hypothetical protein